MFAKTKFMWKTDSSGNGDCPSITEVDGGYVLVGKNLDAATTEQIAAVGRANNSGIGPDETAVFLPADVDADARVRVHERGDVGVGVVAVRDRCAGGDAVAVTGVVAVVAEVGVQGDGGRRHGVPPGSRRFSAGASWP